VNHSSLRQAASDLKEFFESNGFGEVYVMAIELIDGEYVEVPDEEYDSDEPTLMDSEHALEAEKACVNQENVSISELDGATAALAQLLDANGIRYSVEQEGKSDIQYRGENTYLRIEITQFFSNAGCAMTYLNKQWRDNPFAEGDIGNIDISISSQHEYFVTILYPQNLAHDLDALEQVKQQIESLKMQATSDLYKGMQCSDYLGTPCLWFTYAMNDPSKDTPDYAVAFLQLLALEIHRIFGSIVVPTGA